MPLLRRPGIEMHAQRRIPRTAQLAMLIRVPESEIRFHVAQVRGLREELRGVGFVAEDIVPVTRLVQKTELVRRGVVLEIRTLGCPFEPLQPFAVMSVQTHTALQARAS